MKRLNLSSTDIALLATVATGMLLVIAISRSIDKYRQPVDSVTEEERLYVSAATVDRMSLAFSGLAADWYWMRSLQYVGRRIINLPENVQLDDMGQLNLKLLAPLLDAATTLDPQFMEPYQYAAVVLPSIDRQEAIRIIRKGIAANPDAWRLYHQLGYIYWQQKDFQSAGEAYDRGTSLPGAPAWMKVMKARMVSEGGSRDTAREIYHRMYEEAGDPEVKEMARRRLLQLTAWDQIDVLKRLMEAYRTKTGSCPANWSELDGVFRALRVRNDASSAPLDPGGTPYLLVKEKCDVEIDWHSEVPVK